MNLDGSRVLITGGSSGIGQAIAIAMAARGAVVVVTGRDQEWLRAVADGNPLETQLQEVDIDVNGPIRLVDAFLPSLLHRSSLIINVSSGLAWVPYSPAPVYSGAKAFVHAWTVALRAQLAGTSVRVIELLPPVTDTAMASNLDAGFARMDTDDLVAALMRGIDRGQDEIAPGQSVQLKWLSRIASRFIFSRLNRATGMTRSPLKETPS